MHHRFDRGFELGIKFVVNVDRRRPADDERRARFIDEDGVDFVHDGEVMAALHLFFQAAGHAVVAQIIEAKLGVRAVGDVAGILGAAFGGRLIVQNAADGQAEKPINRAHPFAVAGGEVIIDRDDVHAASAEGIEINGQRGDQRLAFAGGHFRDASRCAMRNRR